KPTAGIGCAPLPDIKKSGSHQIAYLRTDSLNIKLNMVVETQHTGNIRFNWDPTVLTPADFQPLVGLPSLSWCSKEVGQYLPAGGRMHIQCDSSRFILGVIEYDTAGAAYTILTDYATPASVRFDMDDTFCQGDSIHFSYTSHNVAYTRLQSPNGIMHDMPYSIPNADTSMSGRYWLYGYDTLSTVPIAMDYIDITINPRHTAEIHETILQSQLPWSRFDILFYAETDTNIFRPDPMSVCDSLINYHLHIYDTLYDTILYYACESDLPIRYNDTLFTQEGQAAFLYTGSHGEDSLVTFILHVIPSSDTTICDSITEDQLPWFAMDTVFNDTVADYIVRTINEAGCDSIIHYNLYIFWNGDHCDTSLSYPNVVTPNGDGVNDRFVIGGLIEHNCFRYNELIIYDRYGHCVYHKRNIATESDWWNPAAQRAPSGTYFYYFKAHGINIWTQHRGVIEVLRDK
ncbi:MAG: gliding motility-associated C-terminal domain-containing protein, partial [Bacteroidales bacterium]|nr:gliding motility-associated C-terminal domain-containing protein [Bacteroidales bacterium]